MALTAVKYADFEKICVVVNEALLIKLKELKKEYGMSWNGLFLQLIQTNERPEDLVRRYKRIFENPKKKKVRFEPWLAPKTIIKFGVWCAPFSNQTDAIDYLLNSEKSKTKFVSLDKITAV